MNDDIFNRGPLMVVGIDEVGRGCLAGPVSACAFAFRVEGTAISKLKDSKKMTPAGREKIIPHLETAGYFGHGSSTSEEIDELKIVAANYLAMRRALENLMQNHGLRAENLHVVVDGNQLPPFEDLGFGRFHCLVKADDLVPEVSAASVLAKVKRDLWMKEQAVEHPGYGFESHAGYGSSQHMQAIRDLGPCALHRLSFTLPARQRPSPRP